MVERLEPKDPSDIKDYGLDWSAVLAGESETTIETSSWSVVPAGLTLATSPPPSISGGVTTVWVSGGTAGTTYSLINTIVTGSNTPRTHQRSVLIPCVDR